MERTITVKGLGRASVKPDQMELHMLLCFKHRDYARMMAGTTEQLEGLKRTLGPEGLPGGAEDDRPRYPGGLPVGSGPSAELCQCLLRV